MAKKVSSKIALFFLLFALGFLTATILKNPLSPTQTTPTLTLKTDNLQIGSGNLSPLTQPTPSPPPQTNLAPKTPRTGKYIITATTPLVADRLTAETGEQVNFNLTLKNEGTKKKFLTHICFNHSGGETFGCLLNKNLFPAESFNLNNGMIFTSPGRYTVSVALSQDGVNFFPPLNSNPVTIAVE